MPAHPARSVPELSALVGSPAAELSSRPPAARMAGAQGEVDDAVQLRAAMRRIAREECLGLPAWQLAGEHRPEGLGEPNHVAAPTVRASGASDGACQHVARIQQAGRRQRHHHPSAGGRSRRRAELSVHGGPGTEHGPVSCQHTRVAPREGQLRRIGERAHRAWRRRGMRPQSSPAAHIPPHTPRTERTRRKRTRSDDTSTNPGHDGGCQQLAVTRRIPQLTRATVTDARDAMIAIDHASVAHPDGQGRRRHAIEIPLVCTAPGKPAPPASDGAVSASSTAQVSIRIELHDVTEPSDSLWRGSPCPKRLRRAPAIHIASCRARARVGPSCGKATGIDRRRRIGPPSPNRPRFCMRTGCVGGRRLSTRSSATRLDHHQDRGRNVDTSPHPCSLRHQATEREEVELRLRVGPRAQTWGRGRGVDFRRLRPDTEGEALVPSRRAMRRFGAATRRGHRKFAWRPRPRVDSPSARAASSHPSTATTGSRHTRHPCRTPHSTRSGNRSATCTARPRWLEAHTSFGPDRRTAPRCSGG